MYAQLGNIIFEGAKGFSSLEQTFGVNYAQHERINQKARLQRTGDALDTISFDMYLHAQFTDPEADIEAIAVAMKNGEILPLILGSGTVVGNFVIPTYTVTTSFTDPLGRLIEATVSVELLEAYSADPLLDAKRQAQSKGFATAERNSNVRSVLPPKLSPGMETTETIADIDDSGKLVTQYGASVTENPATSGFYSNRIGGALDSIEENIQKVQDQLAAVPSLNTLSPGLLSAISSVNSRVQDLRGVLPISDVSSFNALVGQLSSAISFVKVQNSGISNQSIIRRI